MCIDRVNNSSQEEQSLAPAAAETEARARGMDPKAAAEARTKKVMHYENQDDSLPYVLVYLFPFSFKINRTPARARVT